MQMAQTKWTAREIVERVLDDPNAKVFKRGWYDEGTVESGPYGGVYYGKRLGKVEVTVGEHDVHVWWPSEGIGYDNVQSKYLLNHLRYQVQQVFAI
jgi:hypothetical protein